MKARCPKNPEHKQFFTGAVVCQTWRVNDDGFFIEVSESCTDVYRTVSPANLWECAECGSEAIVEG